MIKSIFTISGGRRQDSIIDSNENVFSYLIEEIPGKRILNCPGNLKKGQKVEVSIEISTDPRKTGLGTNNLSSQRYYFTKEE